MSISHKPQIGSSLNLDRECITSWRITVASFSSIQCTVFEKMTIITYSQFAFFSKSVMWVCLIFGVKIHYNGSHLFANFSSTHFVFCEILVQEVQLQHIFIHVHLQKCRNWNGHIFLFLCWILMIFGEELYNTKMNNLGNFHPNPMYGFW